MNQSRSTYESVPTFCHCANEHGQGMARTLAPILWSWAWGAALGPFSCARHGTRCTRCTPRAPQCQERALCHGRASAVSRDTAYGRRRDDARPLDSFAARRRCPPFKAGQRQAASSRTPPAECVHDRLERVIAGKIALRTKARRRVGGADLIRLHARSLIVRVEP
eukprot:CAMPEP_0115834510 /NCGR_PEP_ID=MMETSP0287-20121206/3719_1 /TAXON_ID=412157 /ORGANISM="Chrysochromulina rotalis, Strain UIO044" /LENGTH=164 /DNA_ID=CAMNT_0003287945 /DNA_START=65 /DNA_END=559 /DNA_ORIENTATION=-